MSPDEYLARIGVDPAQVTAPDYDTLARLVAAHATSVPFETLAVTHTAATRVQASRSPSRTASRR